MIKNNNEVMASGKIIEDVNYIYDIKGEKIYKTCIQIERLSGVKDIIPVVIREKDIKEINAGDYVCINGYYSSIDARLERKVVRPAIVVEKIDNLECELNQNYIKLDGYICTIPRLKETSKTHRLVAEFIIAVNSSNGSNYIPCIAWGTNAKFISSAILGAHITLEGRMQSRDFYKVEEDGNYTFKVAHEISINNFAFAREEWLGK